MKRTLTMMAMAVCTLFCSAQITPVEKYEIAPGAYEQVYLDQISQYKSKVIYTPNGEYVGQVDSSNRPYGYGILVYADGSHTIGKFRENQLLFGITVSGQSAMVGSPTFYAAYDQVSGGIDYVFCNNQKRVLEGPDAPNYSFQTLNYANGDQYVGELYQGKRHGYGIYYYSNGDFWFGEYGNDRPWGYGAFFTAKSGLFVGEWQGQNAMRVTRIKMK